MLRPGRGVSHAMRRLNVDQGLSATSKPLIINGILLLIYRHQKSPRLIPGLKRPRLRGEIFDPWLQLLTYSIRKSPQAPENTLFGAHI